MCSKLLVKSIVFRSSWIFTKPRWKLYHLSNRSTHLFARNNTCKDRLNVAFIKPEHVKIACTHDEPCMPCTTLRYILHYIQVLKCIHGRLCLHVYQVLRAHEPTSNLIIIAAHCWNLSRQKIPSPSSSDKAIDKIANSNTVSCTTQILQVLETITSKNN